MTKKVTIMTGSVRPNSVGDKLLPVVQSSLEAQGVEVQVASLRELQLPFFDSEEIPSSESYSINQENVKQWQSLVVSSDGIVMLTPEYNYQMAAAQKNAIDWLYKEWKDKAVSIVSYGWSGGEKAATPLKALLEKLQAKPLDKVAKLYFTKQISPDGLFIDESEVKALIDSTVSELVESI
ncbi:NAD(P)H-dependent oxidoreductase [Candidatus Saccharibacteria bacterium]|jgi:NAD(P)H-dependent FMN reductase|nr:NAD(P)H-dependent oxidoreductase [Candidatus Saccharibacteria bacterium]